jgi:hypothetical protein
MNRRRKHKPGTSPVKDHCGATKKARYHSAGAAANALETVQQLRRARGRGKSEQRSYYCALCGGWHLTSSPE